MAEKHGGKAMVNFAKRAKRVQEKMMQKFGKSDQTKDEVYEEFVVNFNKQNTAALKLQKELVKYMNVLRTLSQSTRSLADTIDELYEPDWEGRPQYKSVVEKQGLLWDDKLTTLQSKMVEPLSHYVSRFPEVRSRIQKRDRKVVDYDLTRRELDSIKAKPKVTDQKVQAAEEAYTHAKQLYDEISDELYEELPSFYDSRIQFYASLIQSIATTEAKFDSEIAKVNEELADLMDSTASQAATGMHSTKRERSIVDKGPRLLSRPGEELESPTSVDPPLKSPPPAEALNHSSGSSSTSTASSTPTRSGSSLEKPPKPSPFSGDSSSVKHPPPTKPVRSSTSADSEGAVIKPKAEEEAETSAASPQPQPPVVFDEPPVTFEEPLVTTEEPLVASEEPLVVPEEPLVVSEETSSPKEPETVPETPLPIATPIDPAAPDDKEPTDETPATPRSPPPKPDPPSVIESDEETGGDDAQAIEATKESTVESTQVAEPPIVLYKLKASHPYAGDDEDELCFEKGDIILVIPFEDPEDEEEGWKMGMVEGSLKTGVFPENFTKRIL
ncbi:myc box-dependent-interacting protein 1-like [Halichondria panicea]|uniref:myc box-dependent-interacting protein 1-like n=1 Tax=Halichondria panicea TaxID=6063 RepID=UPI00312BB30D